MPKVEPHKIEEKVLAMVRKAIQFNEDLREKYQIGHKFRFVSDRLNALLHQLEQSKTTASDQLGPQDYEVASDEMLVFVHLYNVHGLKLPSWQNMLNPKLFYEYSVNRPIYKEKQSIENMIRSKSNKFQHAYITIAINKSNILSPESESPIIKVREGSLHFDKFISFTHNELDYRVNEEGVIVKK